MPTSTSTPAQESGQGKSYGYQRPTESEAGSGSDLEDRKAKVVSAFDNFLDALADRVSGMKGGTDYTGNGSTAGTDHTGPTDSKAPSTGSGATGATTSTTTATTTGAGRPSEGTAAAPYNGTGGAYGGSSSGEKASEAATLEAQERSTTMQREAYRMDRVRESIRATRRETGTPPVMGLAPIGMTDKHHPDSNRAPLTESKAFGPSFGAEGRPHGSTTRERMAMPLSQRPETVPAPGSINGKPIDAYWGSFGTALERATVRAKLNYEALEVILGTDDRVRVTNNQVYPWRCICSLLITSSTGAQYIGTGWLVAPRLLLTAGHCVYMSDEGGWVTQIEVIPGRDATNRPFGSAIATDFRSVSGWTRDTDSDYDYGAIILPTGHRFGDQLGWFGYACRTDDYLRNVTLNLSGYPGDGGKAPNQVDGTQWFASRTVKDVLERQITYEIDTYGGQSGSPVWEMATDGSRYGVAVHTWGTPVSNGGTRITGELFDNIVRWAGEAP